ncbi:MAG: CHAP domain-containing protein [Acetobacteraceae bacterium]|nr:CHAP domain-containing protein [Acetobacteraceae bacterium]MCX7685939.1 CHAP domain-containing protein [Acetobacteraceae bacterium]MDW8398406.1 CHAP domain-containing protein [Acetobacteraceae bacterium]
MHRTRPPTTPPLARRGLALGLIGMLSACASRPAFDPREAGLSEPISCVPYARARSGIRLQGDAWTWWDAAAGRYARGRAPRPGSVLVIDRTPRMREGHVAVVRRILGPRDIRVDHANWASGAARGRILHDQPVRDVSPWNDWSRVLVWYPPIGDFGRTAYAARGFVHPEPLYAASKLASSSSG